MPEDEKDENQKTLDRVIRAVTTVDPVERVARFYEIQSPAVEFANRTDRYMNLGYWDDTGTDLEEAASAMADLLADAADLKPGVTVLDAGFGFGDQDFRWVRQRDVGTVYGFNITPHQVAAAQERARAEGLSDRLDFRLGSALETGLPDESVDRVVALESAFHFYPRSAFFTEALRVLRPGGVIATADIIPVDPPTPRTDFKSGPLSFVQYSVPDDNWHGAESYREELVEAGFVQPRVESIRERVWPGWRRYMLARIADPDFQRAIGKLQHDAMAEFWSQQELMGQELELLDYVIAVARKP
jgi:cyclopropane fatty-acyl-phospholipid synthase-like methyltransferase